jgi:predicted DNA-binding protein (MmcQ/YjbR family)
MTKRATDVHKRLVKTALAYPEAWEDHPWGEIVAKVGKKVFVFFGRPREGVSLSCKLPHSFDAALSMFSFAEPTGYGLGASGWVTASFEPGDDVPEQLLLDWIEESYRAVAPAKLVKQLPAREDRAAPRPIRRQGSASRRRAGAGRAR